MRGTRNRCAGAVAAFWITAAVLALPAALAIVSVVTSDADAQEVDVQATPTVNGAPEVGVVPEGLEVDLDTNDSTVETVDIHNLGAATLHWTIPIAPAPDPLIGFNFTTSSSSTPDPQNWTRISTIEGTMTDVPDDTGAPSGVDIAWGGVTSSGPVYVGTSTLGPDAVPQYDYDLSGMSGYGFRADAHLFVELSGLAPNTPYEFWFVAYRATSNIGNLVEVSDGETPAAIQFAQQTTTNDGRFVVNETIVDTGQDWNDLSLVTRSGSTGVIRFEWTGPTASSDTAVIGALAIREAFICALPGWLSIAPTSGTIVPEESPDTVSVTLDSTGLGPGTHTDSFCVESNDPFQPVVPVPVTLTVTLADDEAIIEGTVQSLSPCGVAPSGLEGATVEIVGAQNTFTVTTDENGFYQAFLNQTESPIDINATAAEHLAESVQGLTFVSGDTVVEDFDLTALAPCGTSEPSSFSFEVEEGSTASDTLTIGNVAGLGDLTWAISEAEPLAITGGTAVGHAPASAGESAGAGGTGAASPDESMDLVSQLGEPPPSLNVMHPLGGEVVDCDAEPGLVLHDDGTVETGYSGNPATVNQVIFVDKFTPTSYPTEYRAVCLAFLTVAGGPTSLDVEIVVYDDNGAFGAPGTELGSMSVTVAVPQVSLPQPGLAPVWNSFDVSSLGITVHSGSVYVGARWMPPSPTNVFISSDESSDRPVGFAGGYWWTSNSQSWATIQSDPVFEQYRSLMVRAVELEQPIVCDNPTDAPWLSVNPGVGTTPAGGTSDVQVSVDANGLAPGQYAARLCLATNDGLNDLVVIPVGLTVTPVVGPPVIDVDPSSLSSTLEPAHTETQGLAIANLGEATLDWQVTEVDCTLPGWVRVNPTSGSVVPAGSQLADVTFDSTGLAPDTYTANLCLATNDPATPVVPVPVVLTVTEAPPGLVPTALVVDPDELVSNGNKVFEPGELVDLAPSWQNLSGASVNVTGTATGFTGPTGADHVIAADFADYGLVAAGATASCLDTETCYGLSVSDPAPRPAAHWDSVVEEELSDGTMEPWALHIGDSFSDVPRESLFYRAIETLLHRGVTAGCGGTEYCSAGTNSRGQMAVFLLKAVEDADYLPPACEEGEERFLDVPADSLFCSWIEELAAREITTGCGGDNFCPGASVTRAQMAIFLLRAALGSGYTPPACTEEFADVPCSSIFAVWIEDLAERGITGGCGDDHYCPADAVTRAQMAVFVTKAFGLTLYGP